MSRDDLHYWYLTPRGWEFGGDDIEGYQPAIKPRPPDCLCVAVFHSPNKMYSSAYWDEDWLSQDSNALAAAREKFGVRPPRSVS